MLAWFKPKVSEYDKYKENYKHMVVLQGTPTGAYRILRSDHHMLSSTLVDIDMTGMSEAEAKEAFVKYCKQLESDTYTTI